MQFVLWAIVLILFVWIVYSVVPTCYYKYLHNNSFSMQDGAKQIMLTFDDGPDCQYTDILLDLLAENQIKATFFLVAEKAVKYQDVVQRIYEQGHQIGFHSLKHRNFWFGSYKHSCADFAAGISILQKIGCSPKFFRPPFGILNMGILFLIKKYDLQLLLWTVMAQDWRADATAETILAKLRQRSRPGSVICLHDSAEDTGGAQGAAANTIQALREFIPEMKKQGYVFVLPGVTK